MQALAEVHKVQDVLLETGTSEANAGLQEFGANAGIEADRVSYLVNVGTSGFADGRKRVDGRDSLREHGVGGQFRQFGRPKTDSKDTLLTIATSNEGTENEKVRHLRNPVSIYISQRGASIDTLRCLE